MRGPLTGDPLKIPTINRGPLYNNNNNNNDNNNDDDNNKYHYIIIFMIMIISIVVHILENGVRGLLRRVHVAPPQPLLVLLGGGAGSYAQSPC